jgi:hypothetical protein
MSFGLGGATSLAAVVVAFLLARPWLTRESVGRLA